jgi:hypothetical protein
MFFHVDNDQLEPGGHLHRKVAWVGAAQNTIHIGCSLPILIDKVIPVRDGRWHARSPLTDSYPAAIKDLSDRLIAVPRKVSRARLQQVATMSWN